MLVRVCVRVCLCVRVCVRACVFMCAYVSFVYMSVYVRMLPCTVPPTCQSLHYPTHVIPGSLPACLRGAVAAAARALLPRPDARELSRLAPLRRQCLPCKVCLRLWGGLILCHWVLQANTHTHTRTHTHTHIQVRTHTNARIHTHSRTHAHVCPVAAQLGIRDGADVCNATTRLYRSAHVVPPPSLRLHHGQAAHAAGV